MDGLGIPTLDTERLRPRALLGSDFEDYAALDADPEVGRQMVFYGLDRETYLRQVAPADVTARRAG